MHPIFEFCKSHEVKLFRDGSLILEEGNNDKKLFVLESGEVDIIKCGKVIANINASGSLVGEISAILSAPYTSSCRARGDVSMYVINAEDLSLEKNTNLLLIIAKELCIKLYRTTNNLTAATEAETDYTLSNKQRRDLRLLGIMSDLCK